MSTFRIVILLCAVATSHQSNDVEIAAYNESSLVTFHEYGSMIPVSSSWNIKFKIELADFLQQGLEFAKAISDIRKKLSCLKKSARRPCNHAVASAVSPVE